MSSRDDGPAIKAELDKAVEFLGIERERADRAEMELEILRAKSAELVRQLWQRTHGLPDDPWIPGGEFADGELMAALHAAEEALTEEGAE
jgi:hypothetical protein